MLEYQNASIIYLSNFLSVFHCKEIDEYVVTIISNENEQFCLCLNYEFTDLYLHIYVLVSISL